MKSVKADIYRSSKRDEMYAYVPRPEGQNTAVDPETVLPPMMMKAFGKPQYVMTVDLSPGRRLARVDVQLVLESLARKGFFIQMPPDGLINPSAPAPEGLRGA